MFEVFKIQKSSSKKQKNQIVIDKEPLKTPALVCEDDEMSGTEINLYAKRQQMPVSDVWKQIREGRLLARTENGYIYVYGSELSGLPQITEVSGELSHQDSQELLRYSQNAIDRIQQLNDDVIASKNEVIAAKDEKIADLESNKSLLIDKTDSVSRENLKLKQKVEDLEMLVTTLSK